jgi:hypothetical protein
VGSKGTGKTATFYQIRDQLADKTVLICDIKPAGYKIARFIESLKKLSNPHSMATHVAESAWKMIIYSHLISTLKNEFDALPVQANLKSEQDRLLKFANRFSFIVNVPFEQQLDVASDWLGEQGYDSDNFTKVIHERFLSEAKSVISAVISQKKRTIILLDNLDKEWMVESDLKIQSQMVFSILGLHRKLETELGSNVNISVIVFLRRNIFEFILKQAREPDKLIADSIELSWDDKQMLLRVVEERFKSAVERISAKPINPWETFFTDSVEGEPTQHWIFNSILPRPRDLIHFLRKSIEFAINRGHSKIQEDDLLSALKSHSAFALDQIIAEYQAEETWLPKILRSFFSCSREYTFVELKQHIEKRVGAKSEKDTRDMMATLVAVRFMGVGSAQGSKFRYASTIQEGMMLTEKVKNHPEIDELFFHIHPVFKLHLGLEDVVVTKNELTQGSIIVRERTTLKNRIVNYLKKFV